MQLVEVDRFAPEPPQAQLGLLAQVLGAAQRDPLAAEIDLPALGGDHYPRPVRVERLGEQFLVVAQVVGVRGVDERHAEFDRAPGDLDRDGAVQPGRLAGQSHGTESKPTDRQVAADGEGGGVVQGEHVSPRGGTASLTLCDQAIDKDKRVFVDHIV